MDLVYILDGLTLEKTGVIEEYESLVWTERFIEAGEVQITMGATHENAVKLRPGTLLLHEDSDEPMQLETRSIKDGTITATGNTIEAFFNERYVGPLGRSGLADNIIRYVVYNMQNRQEGRFAIPNLRPQDFVADDDSMGHEEHITEFEKGHDAVLRLANKYSLGVAVKRQRNPDTNQLELVFVVRETNDRTRNNPSGNDYVRFSPKDDTFAGIEELYSLTDWVDVILVHAPKAFAKTDTDPAYGWPPTSYPDKTAQGGPEDFWLPTDESPFNWRVTEITADDIDQAFIDKRVTDYWNPVRGFPASWFAMTFDQWQTILREEIQAKGRDEWHKRQAQQKVVFSGEIPGERFVFNKDYRLGDLVDVEGTYSGTKQTAMISEYIRAADGTGRRSYPTLVPALDTYSDPTAVDGGWGGSGT